MTLALRVNEAQLHIERLERARVAMRRHGLAAMLLFDQMNVRYVSFQGLNPVFTLHHSFRWVLVPAESRPILWEFPGCFPNIPSHWSGETRPAVYFTFFGSGANTTGDAKKFAAEIASALCERGLAGETVGIDRLETV